MILIKFTNKLQLKHPQLKKYIVLQQIPTGNFVRPCKEMQNLTPISCAICKFQLKMETKVQKFCQIFKAKIALFYISARILIGKITY